MAQERFVTPEKQLLKLIEDPKKESAGVNSRAIRYRRNSLFSFSAWLSRAYFFKNKLSGGFDHKDFRKLDVKAINNILFLSIIILAAYFIFSFSVSMVDMKKSWDSKFKISDSSSQSEGSVEKVSFLKKAESYYLEKVRQRDIFRIGAKNIVGNAEAVMKDTSSKAIDATKHLRLVGISWSSDPDAMVEDTIAVRTFFVKRGQTLGADIRVEAILKDKVILSYKGEEVELR
jgi:hypothetical protein